ncbi:hypothetical protein U9M48_041537 [Paspalum notatum var. saurae]|uniref:Uncharacterized protein n=1 Tax=Paspalum notatum var. saurae TaxID=547442 RepID=A0AAQ3UNK6_PASNO
MPPSLELIPAIPGSPLDVSFCDWEAVLLRCHSHQGDNSFYCLAVLRRVFGKRQDIINPFALHLYSSKTGRWSTRSMHVDSPNKDFSYTNTSTVLAARHRRLHQVFREMRYLAGRRAAGSNGTGCTCATTEGGWVAATKKMKISDIGSGNNWEDDCTIKFSEIPVDSPNFARMLPNLKHATTDTKPTLRRLNAGYPALSLHDSDIVYIMHTPDPDEDKASAIAVDMRNKTLKDVADFGSGRPLGLTYTYHQSGISKHLSIYWSSRRSFNLMFVLAA